MRLNILFLGHKNPNQCHRCGTEWLAQQKSCWSTTQLNMSQSLTRQLRRPKVSWPSSEIVWPTGPGKGWYGYPHLTVSGGFILNQLVHLQSLSFSEQVFPRRGAFSQEVFQSVSSHRRFIPKINYVQQILTKQEKIF